jgi:RNA polymerase sigma-70 factor (ECF subfamily)
MIGATLPAIRPIDCEKTQVMVKGAPSDEDLLAMFARGDGRAAAELTGRLAPRVLSVALRISGDRAEAEDITQDAMLRLWRMAPDWQPGAARISTWLYRVTVNLCLDRKRKGRTTALEDIHEPVDPAPTVSQTLQHKTRVEALQDALMQLPDRQRQAIVLRHIEELPNPQTADILGISTEAVESLVARGKRALSSILGKHRKELGYEDDGT